MAGSYSTLHTENARTIFRDLGIRDMMTVLERKQLQNVFLFCYLSSFVLIFLRTHLNLCSWRHGFPDTHTCGLTFTSVQIAMLSIVCCIENNKPNENEKFIRTKSEHFVNIYWNCPIDKKFLFFKLNISIQ